MLTTALCLAAVAPVPVRIETTSAGFRLLRGGRPYYVKGAGAPKELLTSLRAAGGNSVRTWGADDLEPLLDAAHRLGMTVTIGFWLQKKTDGFDYTNSEAVRRQFEACLAGVRRYRNHPALLMWGIGNEMELGDGSPEMWRAVEQIAAMIKREDPNHPSMTVVADMWPEKLAAIKQYCPSLDAIGVNSYGGLPTLHERMKDWPKPYLITEFAHPIQQQRPRTPWDSPIELDTAEKARLVRENWQDSIEGRKSRVLGGYLFHWSKSDAATASWYAAFLKTGEKTEVVDAAAELWGGKVGNRAPRIVRISPEKPVETAPGATLDGSVHAMDAERDPLDYRYEILSDDPAKRFVGDFEKSGGAVATGLAGPTYKIGVPNEPGPYRLVLVIRDGKGGAAVATIPFRVSAKPADRSVGGTGRTR